MNFYTFFNCNPNAVVLFFHATEGAMEKKSSTQLGLKSRKWCHWRLEFAKGSNKRKAVHEMPWSQHLKCKRAPIVASAKVSHCQSLSRRDAGDAASSESKRHRSGWLWVQESVAGVRCWFNKSRQFSDPVSKYYIQDVLVWPQTRGACRR